MNYLMREVLPGLKEGWKILASEIAGLISSAFGTTYFVDGDDGSDSNAGLSPADAKKTIQGAVDVATHWDTIIVKALDMASGATDPSSYAENIVVPATCEGLRIIGDSYINRTQGGLPQLKVGAVTTQALITVRAPGVTIAGLGINGVGGTGGGIKLDDDGSTKTAFGTSILGCHLKNCVGSTATDCKTGAAIMLAGAPWQVRISGNRFYKNVGDIVATATYVDAKDVTIDGNLFSGSAAATDCNIYMVGTGGDADGLVIADNFFPAMPALSGGAVKRYVDLTGYTGMMARNYFGSIVSPTGSAGTFAADGTLAKIPATVFIASCWGETTTTGETGEIFRT